MFLLLVLPAILTASSFDEIASRAAAARKANHLAQAMELYQQGLALRPEWKQGLWYLGTLDYDSSQYPACRDTLHRLVALDANAAPAWALLGLCEFETGEYAKSLADMKRGISLGAGKDKQMGVVVLYHEGLALALTGKFDEALQKYRNFVRAGAAKNDTMLLSIGAAALHARLLPKNIPAGQQALYRAAGETASLVLAGKYQEADQSFAKLLVQYPDTPNVHYLYGQYMLARDIGTAIDQFERELKIDSGNAGARTMLAFALLTRGDSKRALPYAQEAARQAPDSPMAQYVYGRALVQTANYRRGIAQLLHAEPMNASNIDVHITLAVAYSHLGEPVEARRERTKALQMTKESMKVAQP